VKWHLTRLDAQRKVMIGKWQDSPYLFVSITTGDPVNPGVIWTHFKAAAKAVGIAARLHDLRR
jgi:hypothetical protein